MLTGKLYIRANLRGEMGVEQYTILKPAVVGTTGLEMTKVWSG